MMCGHHLYYHPLQTHWSHKSFKHFQITGDACLIKCLRITFLVENGKVQVTLSEDRPNRSQQHGQRAWFCKTWLTAEKETKCISSSLRSSHTIFNKQDLQMACTTNHAKAWVTPASARKLAPAHRAQFRERLLMIEQQRRAMLQKKQDDIRMKEQKVLQEKEKPTSEVVLIGVWQTQDDVA